MDCLDVHNATSEQRRDISGKEVHILEEGRGGHSNSEYDEPLFFSERCAKGQGNGRGEHFSGQCHFCGRWWHRLAECPVNDTENEQGQRKRVVVRVGWEMPGKTRRCQCKRVRKNARQESLAGPLRRKPVSQVVEQPAQMEGRQGACVLGQ